MEDCLGRNGFLSAMEVKASKILSISRPWISIPKLKNFTYNSVTIHSAGGFTFTSDCEFLEV